MSGFLIHIICHSQYEYEVDSNGDRVVLRKGSFGAVYSAIDLVTKRKMAVKKLNDTLVSHKRDYRCAHNVATNISRSNL